MSSSWKKRVKDVLLTTLVVVSAFSCGKKGGQVDPVDPSSRLTATATITPQTGVNVGDEYVLNIGGDGLDAELSYNIQGTLPTGRDTLLTGVAQPTTATNYVITRSFTAQQAGNASFVVNLEDSELYNSAADKVTTAASVDIPENIPENTPVDTSFTAPRNVLTGDEAEYRLQIHDVDNGGGSIFETLPDGSTKQSVYAVPFDSTFTNTFSQVGEYTLHITFRDTHPTNQETKEFNLKTTVSQAMENREIVVQANNEQTGVGLAGKTAKLYSNGSEIGDLVLDETGRGSFDITVPEGSEQTYSVGVLAHGYTDEQTDIVSDEEREDVVFDLTPSAITLSNPEEINPWSTRNMFDVTSIYASTDVDTGDEVALVSSLITSLDSRLELVKQGNSYRRNMVGDAHNENIGLVVNVSSKSNSLEQEVQQAIDAKELVNQIQSVINGNQGISVEVDMKEYFESNVYLLSMNFSSPNTTVTDLGNFVYRFNQDAAFFGNIDVDAKIVNVERDTLDTVMSYIVAETPKISVTARNAELRAPSSVGDGIYEVLRVIEGTDSVHYVSDNGEFTDIKLSTENSTLKIYTIDDMNEVTSFVRTLNSQELQNGDRIDVDYVSFITYGADYQQVGNLEWGAELADSPDGWKAWFNARYEALSGMAYYEEGCDINSEKRIVSFLWSENTNNAKGVVFADTTYVPYLIPSLQTRIIDDRPKNIMLDKYAEYNAGVFNVLPGTVETPEYITLQRTGGIYEDYVVLQGVNDGVGGEVSGLVCGNQVKQLFISLRGPPHSNVTATEALERYAATELDLAFSHSRGDYEEFMSLNRSVQPDISPLRSPSELDWKLYRINATTSFKNEKISDVIGLTTHSSNLKFAPSDY